MLRDLGQRVVLTASTLDEALTLIRENSEHLTLLVSEWSAVTDGDPRLAAALSTPILSQRCTWLLIATQWELGSKLEQEGSRIDGNIYQPFARPMLASAIARASARRATFRRGILLLGSRLAPRIGELVNWPQDGFIFRTLYSAETPAQAQAILDREPSLGAVIVDPASKATAFVPLVRKFKRTPTGIALPILCASQVASETHDFRLLADLFVSAEEFESPRGIRRVLELLSSRVVHGWYTHLQQFTARELIRDGFVREAAGPLLLALRSDPNRWESHILMGDLMMARNDVKEARLWYERALRLNPCSPYAHLRLISLVQPNERPLIIEKALSYCPHHPQLSALLQPSLSGTL